MDFKFLVCTILLGAYVQFTTAASCENKWKAPYFEIVKDDKISESSQQKDCVAVFEFKEEVSDFKLGTFTLDEKPTLYDGTDYFEVRPENGKFILYAKAPIDYENGIEQLKVKIVASDDNVQFVFNIININDNRMEILPNDDCTVDETLEGEAEKEKTSCSYTIKDKDGIDKTVDISHISAHGDFFEFLWTEDHIGKKTANANLYRKQKLDYDKNRMFVFDWIVKDEVYESTAKIVVTINDLPNRPPQWISIFTQKQFNETLPQEYEVSAMDGDYGVADKITFSCLPKDMSTELLNKLTCKDGDTINTGIINIKPIFRNKDDITTLTFVINACEVTPPNQCTEQKISLMIDDINDHEPNIHIQYLNSDSKIKIDEEKFTNLNNLIEITIEDNDTGLNAQYDVSLSSNIADPDIDVTKIFQTIPNKGYQKTSFQLTIIDASILDFDRTSHMRNFVLTITATELDPSKKPQKADIEFELINWNDEVPEFKKPLGYEVEIEETFGRCNAEELKIKDLYATDLDVGDKVTYTLLGTDIKRKLEISGENKNLVLKTIYTKNTECDIQVFDYEKLGSETTFQIQASDNFKDSKPNKAFAEITIKIKDVNDETPLIEINPPSIDLMENQEDGVKLGVTITGSDPDITDQNLEFGIDWEKSVATKNGQPVDLFKTDYQGCFKLEPKDTKLFIVDEDPPKLEPKYTELFIVDKDPHKNNTPDYEKFDRINLNIYVVDIAQTIEGVSNRDDAVLIINVKDDNDNKPKFIQETIKAHKKVKENSEAKTPIAVVTATDDDVGTKLKYFLEACNGTEELEGSLVTIDDNGQITVDKDRRIDAENNKGNSLENNKRNCFENNKENCFENNKENCFVYQLDYKVCATDDKFTTCEKIFIEVLDVNDEVPKFKEIPKDITELKENSEIGHAVYKVEAYDNDRDVPNNEISYEIVSTPKKSFGIDKNGLITVTTNTLDREEHPVYEITVKIYDNPSDPKDKLSNETKFEIRLKDQNDNCPIFNLNEDIKISENTDKGKVVGRFTVTDADEPGNDNSKIEIKLEDVYSEGNGNRILKKEDFDLTYTNEENNGMATATIKTNKLLRKFYGIHKLLIQAKDKGPEGEGLPPCSHTVLKNVTLIIEKYSFAGPKFKFPDPNTPIIYLKRDQEKGTVLKDPGGFNLPKIEAYDTDVPDKYNIKFTISEKNKGSEYFEIKETEEKNKGQLQYKKKPDDESRQYEIEIIATNDDERPQKTIQNVKIGFYDKGGEPKFKENEIKLSFKEDKEGIEIPQQTRNASCEGPEGLECIIYYLIHQNMHSAFECDLYSGNIKLITPLYLENTTETFLTLRASSTKEVHGEPVDKSLLKINVELIDVNNHPPKFDRNDYAFGIMNGITKTPYTINGTDLDPSDTLTYSMKKGSFQANGTGISTELTFDIRADAQRTCQIVQKFEVKADMDGYFLFDLIVDDSKHTAETHVKVYIISELHLADIIFENTVGEIEDHKKEIEEILSEVLEYTCVVHKVEEASEKGVNIEYRTKIITYCIDGKRNLPISRGDIKTAIGKVETYKKLNKAFGLVGNGLEIKGIDFQVVPENIENVLWAWLISVSVVLGTLCLLLITAFILKNRSWSNRLNKLSTVKFHSQESNLNVAAPPTTNRRAVEGSNPIFNTSSYDDKQITSFDTESISSGESDLIGVENNPAFTMEKFSF